MEGQQGNKSDLVAFYQDLFGLPLDELVENYSAGMKKKLALSGVLALDRDLVMLDEPFNGLDVESVSVLQLVLRRLAAAGKSVIVTSHIVSSLTPVCSAIALLRDGAIRKVCAPAEYDSLASSLREEAGRKYDSLLDSML